MEPSTVVGVDLGVTAPSEVAVAQGGVIEAGRRVASTPKGLTDGLRAAAKGRPVAIVVESTAMAWFVAAVAAVRAGIAHTLYRVSGTKAAALRAFYRSHTKTDHIDARVLARMPAVDEGLRTFRLPTPAELALRRLVGLRHKLGVGATRIANQVRSMLHWAAPGLVRAAGGSVGPGLVAVLKRWPDLRDLARARVATIAATGGWAPERARAVKQAAGEAAAFYEGFVDFADLALELEVAVVQLECLKAQQARVEGRIATMHEGLYPDDRLLTVPGVGPVVAGVVRAVVGDLSRFANLAAFRAYTGLVPREDSSGEARRRGRISKAGPAVLRWALYLAADVARQVDPALADLYRRLMVERGRTHTQALCAVGSHLAGRIWAVARCNREYEWRDLKGKAVSREEARAIAQSLRVDQATRARLRAHRKGGPGAPRTRQPEAPHDATQPSDDKVIEEALDVARKA
ncbi:MAG TPA: IS110 family transposase [Acidimicrobiia bacterium]|nr:IS110 family transposase [Acidimicrobiia bacterium]